MPKILSRSGNSLASVYDVEGSISGLHHLSTSELAIFHEMGATLFSERFSAFIRSSSTGNINQSTAFDVVLTGLPRNFFKINSIAVRISTASRIDLASASLRDITTGRETPIWLWDSATDAEVSARWSDDGGTVATSIFLQPNLGNVMLPHMMAAEEQPQGDVREIAFRGISTAFGAGTVNARILVHVTFAALGGISSRGLPLPSW